MPPSPPSRVTPAEFIAVVREGLPSAGVFDILSLEYGVAVLRQVPGPEDLRPGNNVGGPMLFGLADLAMYAAVMSAAGCVPLAVTTDATVHFLRRPLAGPLIARARLLKAGAKLVIGDVVIAQEADDDAPVAHAIMTYALPPKGRSAPLSSSTH